MKKLSIVIISMLMCAVLVTGCSLSTADTNSDSVVTEYKSSSDNDVVTTYRQLEDGTYECRDKVYHHRIELEGTWPNAKKATTYVVLSDREDVTFDEVSESLYSSDTNKTSDLDFVIVELGTK